MADDTEKKTLTLGGKLSAPKVDTVKQSFSHGRSKTVAVEVRRTRGEKDAPAAQPRTPVAPPAPAASAPKPAAPSSSGTAKPAASGAPRQTIRTLTSGEKEARLRALQTAATETPADDSARARPVMPTVVDFSPPPIAADAASPASPAAKAPGARLDRNALRAREMEELKSIQQIEQQQSVEAEKRRQETVARQATMPGRRSDSGSRDGRDGVRSGGMRAMTPAGSPATGTQQAGDDRTGVVRRPGDAPSTTTSRPEDERAGARRGPGGGRDGERTNSTRRDDGQQAWRPGRMTIEQARNADEIQARARSVASMRRRTEKFARRGAGRQEAEKITRDVIIPEVITVGELAIRMAERAGDVVKSLMKMGVMATTNQTIDADTAELVVTEFGHRFKRVTEGDVELNLGTDEQDAPETMIQRPPVVTIMGHVDHGKTSLLDAFRKTNVVAKESGGITQHIGAYQITTPKGQKVTFIDTPGHAAFTEMRARGANVTDIVILVAAADDSIMPQTIEAIKHAKAAGVPIIVAINKVDLPAANPNKVKQDLLQHDIQVEDMGGETLAVEVSAKTGKGLDKLLEAVMLQAEILELRANPDRAGEGKVIEAKLDRGRGPVATVLVQRGTLRVGDIFVCGSEWGRVRALVNDLGENVKQAGPAMPIEVQGLSAVPNAGDEFIVVEGEAKAREIADYRARAKRQREVAASATARGSLTDMLAAAAAGLARELSVVIKGDVHGSVEAIRGSLEKLTTDNTEVKVRVLDASVGAVSEADVNLANTAGGMVIAFNVRANPQARELARRDGVNIQYYSIIYNIIDDVRNLLSGLLAPTVKENFIGYAEILQVFNITKVGKIAGCKITEGIVRRGAGVRLLRDNVVIHEGKLKTLKRAKEEVKEVREGFECGMAFENYDNLMEGDRIECFELVSETRTLAV